VWRDIARGEHEAHEQVVSVLQVDEFVDDLAVGLVVKLVHEYAVEEGHVFNDSHRDTEKRLEVGGGIELLVDLVEKRKDVDGAERSPSPQPRAASTS
jgi:hypothetical protein